MYTSEFNDEDSLIVINAHLGFTSGGQLPKGWDTNGTYLYKTELEPGKTWCIYSEAICSDLAELLQIEHVSYELVKVSTNLAGDVKIRDAVKCKSYALDAKPVSLFDLMQANDYSKQEARNYICSVNRVLYCQMLLFDFLVANTDRHFRNLGILIRESEVSMIPLYDHDRSLYSLRYNSSSAPFSSVDKWESERLYQGPIYWLLHEASCIMPAKNLMSLCNWQAVSNISDILQRYPGMPQERRESIQTMLQIRLDFMLKELSAL